MDDLQELYQQVIIDHGTKPRNKGELENCSHQADGFNPLCGDEITLYFNMNDNVINDVKFTGEGCAISTASVSLMSQFLVGKTLVEAAAAAAEFTDMATKTPDAEHENLGKLKVLAGVSKYPSRVKCATLAWHTLEAAILGGSEPACTE